MPKKEIKPAEILQKEEAEPEEVKSVVARFPVGVLLDRANEIFPQYPSYVLIGAMSYLGLKREDLITKEEFLKGVQEFLQKPIQD